MKITKLLLVLVILLSAFHWGIGQESNEIKAKKVEKIEIKTAKGEGRAVQGYPDVLFRAEY